MVLSLAAPILRFAMARLEQTAEEQVREAQHRAWTTQPSEESTSDIGRA